MAALLWSSVATILMFTKLSEAQTGKTRLCLNTDALISVRERIMGSSFMLIHVVPVAANLSADGTRVAGGYAVQAGGNITFTCTHNGSSESSLFWELNITNRMATANANTAANLRDKPGIGTSATKNTDNPVSITIYNLQLANNGSTVKCQLEKEGSPAVILVEGMILHCICAPSSLCVLNIIYSCNYVIHLQWSSWLCFTSNNLCCLHSL